MIGGAAVAVTAGLFALSHLRATAAGRSTATCPWCDATMQGDGERFECPNCTGGVFFMEDGELTDAMHMSSRSSGGGCAMCQASLARGERYLPYEDGSTPYAYISCPSCGHENIRYGFGEDDD